MHGGGIDWMEWQAASPAARWTLPDPALSLLESDDFCPSLCAGACWCLPVFGATKGQEKGNLLPVDF